MVLTDAEHEGLNAHDLQQVDAGEELENLPGGGTLGDLALLIGKGSLAEWQGLADAPLDGHE